MWYINTSTGYCVDQLELPSPYPVDTFDDYETCCKAKSWNKGACLERKPTGAPTATPTVPPSTSFPTLTAECPVAYDASGTTKYRKDGEVAVNHVVYRCRYDAYCNQSRFRPPAKDSGHERGKPPLWSEAWERLYRCDDSPTPLPSRAPATGALACNTRWHPGNDLKMRICTNSPTYPPTWDDPVLLLTYFTDTAEECCAKFYRGRKCRIRDECHR